MLLLGSLSVPVIAGERFISGSPNLTAAIQGANYFQPGQDSMIPVVIQNSGLIDYILSYPDILSPMDLPTTAKLMKVTLLSDGAPITIKSDPQLLGDLLGGDTVVVNFRATISQDAPEATYNLPLEISYTYLMRVEQNALDNQQNFYKDVKKTISLPITIKPEVILQAISVDPIDVNAGTQGYLNLTLKNIGNENGREAVVKLVQNGNSPVMPVASSVYIGDIQKGSNVTLQYKISVLRDAEALTYPVNVSVTYKNNDGNMETSDPIIVGVPVGGKIEFKVTSAPIITTPGTSQIIDVTYTNTGSATVYAAMARIFSVDPFTSKDDTSYLGDVAPKDSKIAHFNMIIDSAATLKDYALDSEVLYRDALDNDQVTNRIKVPIQVASPSGIGAILTSPFGLVAIALGIIAVLYVVKTRQKRRS